jgi:hypothetical protein
MDALRKKERELAAMDAVQAAGITLVETPTLSLTEAPTDSSFPRGHRKSQVGQELARFSY